MARLSAILLAAVLVLGLSGHPAQAITNRVTVFAASSLARPLNALIDTYEHHSPDQVRGVYGASGTLADLVTANAPADIFISAHPSWMAALRDRHLVKPGAIRPLAGNRLALLGTAGLDLPANFRRALLQTRPQRIGIADPATVGSGRYATQTLKALDLWDAVKDDLQVLANDPAAVGMVERGELPMAFGYVTDAVGIDTIHVVATAADNLHDPILYSAALLTDAQPGADTFFAFLTGPEGAKILANSGFRPPPAEPAAAASVH